VLAPSKKHETLSKKIAKAKGLGAYQAQSPEFNSPSAQEKKERRLKII
jgi:hypothetical protein